MRLKSVLNRSYTTAKNVVFLDRLEVKELKKIIQPGKKFNIVSVNIPRSHTPRNINEEFHSNVGESLQGKASLSSHCTSNMQAQRTLASMRISCEELLLEHYRPESFY